jgi:hypothetical protein
VRKHGKVFVRAFRRAAPRSLETDATPDLLLQLHRGRIRVFLAPERIRLVPLEPRRRWRYVATESVVRRPFEGELIPAFTQALAPSLGVSGLLLFEEVTKHTAKAMETGRIVRLLAVASVQRVVR